MRNVNIIFTVFNKKDCLPNTLTSISKQKNLENYNVNLYIIDDGSNSKIEKQFILNYLDASKINLHFKSNIHQGPYLSRMDAIDQILLDDTNTQSLIVFQSVDVMYSSYYTLSNLIEHVEYNTFCMSEVINIITNPNTYKNYDDWLSKLNWEDLSNNRKHYQGRNRCDRYYPFLAALDIETLLNLEYRRFYCDVLIDYLLRKHNANIKYILSSTAIHQAHKPIPGARDCFISDCPDKCHRQLGRKFKKPNHRIQPELKTKVQFV